ncbi:MAG: hypothetical protein IJS01_00580 [Lentisphaeria bacterium]|nr:hypothetical protein [Lentisphaeria bacterium]
MNKARLITLFLLGLRLVAGEPLLREDFPALQACWRFSPAGCAETVGGVLTVRDGSMSHEVSATTLRRPLRRGMYRISGRIRITKGFGPLILLDVFDRTGRKLGNPCLAFSSAPKKLGEWNSFRFDAPVPWREAVSFDLRIVSLRHVINEFQLDDLTVEQLDVVPVPPNWRAQYKDPAPGNPADFMGPDGIAYPNFYRAGVQGGIPRLDALLSLDIRETGGVPDGKTDVVPAIEEAIRRLGPRGGVIRLEAGRYRLGSLLKIASNGVILQGAGREKTTLIADYRVGDAGIALPGISENTVLGKNSRIVVLAEPEGLKSITLTLGGIRLKRWSRSMHSGGRFWLETDCGKAASLAPGEYELRAECDYKKGRRMLTKKVRFSAGSRILEENRMPGGLIEFCGPGETGKTGWIAETLLRGAESLVLKSRIPVAPKDWIVIRAQETPERRRENLNTCNWGEFRTYLVGVAGTEGKKILLDQPLRLEFPQRDKVSVRRFSAVERCGIADLTVDVKSPLWLAAVLFRNAANCFAVNVRVVQCGRFPVYSKNGKFLTISKCLFDGARDLGVGGSGYAGFDQTWDSLMDETEVRKMRHAPLFQWAASGNVIRRSRFYGADMHWHAGWTNENLVEQCLIDAVGYPIRDSGYGDAMYATSPEDGSHGPNGPRNVVRNNTIRGEAGGVRCGGMNENWIIVGNVFDLDRGPGVFLKSMAFDTIIRGNVFRLKNPESPMVMIASPDCTGVEIANNVMIGGSGAFWDGLLAPGKIRGNLHLPAGTEYRAPVPEIPSIYLYQCEKMRKKDGKK